MTRIIQFSNQILSKGGIRYMQDINSFSDVFEEEYMEESFKESVNKILRSIQDFFKNMIKKFTDFITRRKLKEEFSQAEQIITKKGLKNKKVEVPDIKEMEKVHEDTMNALQKCKTEKDIQKVMYRHEERQQKLRNKGIKVAMTAAVLLTLSGLIIKNYKKDITKDYNSAKKVITVEGNKQTGEYKKTVSYEKVGKGLEKRLEKENTTGLQSSLIRKNPANTYTKEKLKTEQKQAEIQAKNDNFSRTMAGAVRTVCINRMRNKTSFIGRGLRALYDLGGHVDRGVTRVKGL